MLTMDRKTAEARIAKNTAALVDELAGGHSFVLNLGLGIPTLISSYLHDDNVFVQAENGILGVGMLADEDEGDWDLINAGRQMVTEEPGCCFLSSADAFGMIRGGHVDATVLGAFCVDEQANVANWIIPGGGQLGVGGAMDLVAGAATVIVAMTHCQKSGEPKLVRRCNLPITGFGVVDYIVTERCMMRFAGGRPEVFALACDVTVDELRDGIEFDFTVAPDCRKMIA